MQLIPVDHDPFASGAPPIQPDPINMGGYTAPLQQFQEPRASPLRITIRPQREQLDMSGLPGGLDGALVPITPKMGPLGPSADQYKDIARQGADLVAPNLTSLALGEPEKPPAPFVPNAAGKVPSNEDQRPAGAAQEVVDALSNLVPTKAAAGAALAGASKLLPAAAGFLERDFLRALPAAERVDLQLAQRQMYQQTPAMAPARSEVPRPQGQQQQQIQGAEHVGPQEPGPAAGAGNEFPFDRLAREQPRPVVGEPGAGGPEQPGGGGAAGAAGVAAAQRAAAQAAGPRAALKGLPAEPLTIDGQTFVPGPNHIIHTVAENYMRDAKLPYAPPTTFAPVDKARAQRIAQAFDEMQHDPQNPQVKAAYNQMIKETVAQWKAIEKTGLKIEFIKPGMKDPYEASPRLANADMRDNNHLWVFPTDLGFGTLTSDAVKNNPLLRPTSIVVDGKRLLANDVFRAVHDYFGHFKEGVGFRAAGEENAWRSHSAMYSPLARRAMTSETRGQNSWLNYGPHGDKNRTAKSADTVYADQKIGLLPDWVVNEGAADVGTQAEKFRKTSKPERYVNDAQRNAFPGIYKDPRLIASEAEARVMPEDPALKDLFGVQRGDLFDIARSRQGNAESSVAFAKKPQGSEAGENISTRKNAQRVSDILGEGEKRAPFLTQGMDPWYVMDPAYKRLVELVGPEEAKKRYERLNTMVGMASPGSSVESELNRGTFGHYLAGLGKFDTFKNAPGGFGMAPDVHGHPYHRTAHAIPMSQYLESGKMMLQKPKVRSYIEASGVPETGHVTNVPVGDAHFSRSIGLSDTRKSQDFGKSITTPELQTILPWFRKIADKAGIEPVSAQARMWALTGPQTGIDSQIGAPKLELLAKGIQRTAHKRGVSAQEMRDRILLGQDYIGNENAGRYADPLGKFLEPKGGQGKTPKEEDWFK